MTKSDLEKMSVEDLAERLVTDDLDTVEAGCRDAISSYLFDGFVGYRNQSKEQLVQECCERLGL